jgi:hypothetical protein
MIWQYAVRNFTNPEKLLEIVPYVLSNSKMTATIWKVIGSTFPVRISHRIHSVPVISQYTPSGPHYVDNSRHTECKSVCSCTQPLLPEADDLTSSFYAWRIHKCSSNNIYFHPTDCRQWASTTGGSPDLLYVRLFSCILPRNSNQCSACCVWRELVSVAKVWSLVTQCIDQLLVPVFAAVGLCACCNIYDKVVPANGSYIDVAFSMPVRPPTRLPQCFWFY